MISSDNELISRVEKAIHKCQINNSDDMNEIGYLLGILSEKNNVLSNSIRDDLSIISYRKGDYNRSFDHSIEIMKETSLCEDECKRLRFNQQFSIDKILYRYSEYNPDNVGKMVSILLKNRKRDNKNVTVTITTCKRYDLFYKTVSSFINCCIDLDLIDEWIVVDDNSSEDDRIKMKEDFPFIRYIWKGNESKGHPKSMNIIMENVKTPYIFHIEDDWLFFRREKYISLCMNIVNEDDRYGQCLLNRCYGERSQCHDIIGGFRKFSRGVRYYEHEFYHGEELKEFVSKNVNNKHCVYWPHYSLRVGITRTKVLREIGLYNETANHFEMEYAYRYVKAGYKTTFLDNIYCFHIGRCTFERDSGKQNAYSLNNEMQFGQPINEKTSNESNTSTLILTDNEQLVSKYDIGIPEYDSIYKMKTYVINLKRRPNRFKQFIIDNHDELEKIQYEIFDAIDGQEIQPLPKTLKLFESSDYKYRKGIMGCASSHIKIWHELIISPHLDVMLVLEDDITLAKNFVDKLLIAIRRLPIDKWDILFLGHFLYPQYRHENDRLDSVPEVEHWTREMCITKSMGGTIGYVINKSGSIKMFKHIQERGMYNAIDWVMFKTADINNIFYCYPHIVFSECVTNDIKPDSDIQYDVRSLCDSQDRRLLLELKYWINKLQQSGIKFKSNSKIDIQQDDNSKILYTEEIPGRDDILSYVCIVKTDQNLKKRLEKLPVQYYDINNTYLVIVPHTKINNDNTILEDVTFDGGYLNVDYPV